ncbi:MAG: hypothetical protein IPL43_10130 [Micropruina sp.]|nr:hypothetical protein [Micropruina sp.]
MPELPRGGFSLFPEFRLFGYSGYPGAPGQGRLGIGTLEERLREIESRGRRWVGGRALLPVMELIAVTVHASAGRDGKYRSRTSDAIISTWLKAARKHRALLLLNIQPGRADFLDEVKYFEKWLVDPHAGLALDPEWAVGAGQVPGRVFGSTSGAELNGVGEWVAELVKRHNLPEKVVLYHQLHLNIVKNEKRLLPQPGVVWIKSIDGIGSPGAKVSTYNRVSAATPAFVHGGFKLFYLEDVATGRRLMTPKEVLALRPQPEYILFE